MYRIKDLLVTSYMEWGYYVRAEHVVYDKNNSYLLTTNPERFKYSWSSLKFIIDC